MKTYCVNIRADEQRKSFTGFNFLLKKKIVAVFVQSYSTVFSENGLLNSSEFEITFVNEKNEILREKLQKSTLVFQTVQDFDFLKAISSCENIDLERSYVFIQNPIPNTFINIYFVVDDEKPSRSNER